MNTTLRNLEDAFNELAHLTAFPHYYNHTERLVRRVAVVARIHELRAKLWSRT